jgi:hypothetical protein
MLRKVQLRPEKEHFASKFQSRDRIENISKIKLPILFTASALIGIVLPIISANRLSYTEQMPQLKFQLIEIQLQCL